MKRNPPKIKKKKMPKWKLKGFAKMAKRLRSDIDDSLDKEFGPGVRYGYNTKI